MNRTIERMAVVGTGILGAQIAMLGAHAGYSVKIYDPREGAFGETYEKLYNDIKTKGVEKPLVPWDKWESCRQTIHATSNLDEAVSDAQLVIEAVPENEDLKKKVFTDLGAKTPAGCILATNSSSMPVSRFENACGRPERCLNIHFYFPLQGVNMVDIMGGSKTTADVIETGVEWIRSIGCIPLTVKKEILGFCFNRIWRSIKREALYMWGNDFVDFMDIDRAWMVFTGTKEGPFALMDKVGLDVVHDIEMVYAEDSKDPRDLPPEALKKKIAAGELGVKSGKGFYSYPDPEFLQGDFLTPKK